MEHVERLDERENELRSEVDGLDKQGDELEQRGEQVDEQINEAREDFERKRQSPDTPGAQETEGLTITGESHGGSEADPRPGTSENPGGADEGGQSTGNPPNDDSPAADDDS